MKEMYLRPAVVSADNLEGREIMPLAAVTSVKALALLAGYAAGRVVTKVVEARPSFKLPSLTEIRGDRDDI